MKKRNVKRMTAIAMAAVVAASGVPSMAFADASLSKTMQAYGISSLSQLEDGEYTLTATMQQANGSKSMSNEAINHTVKLSVKDDTYKITVTFHGMSYLGMTGYLQKLNYFTTGYTKDSYGNPVGTKKAADILSYQTNADGSRFMDILGTDYPKDLQFDLIPEAARDGLVPLEVFVPVMESISAGNGTKTVFMKLDWDSLQKTTDSTNSTEPPITPTKNDFANAEVSFSPEYAVKNGDNIFLPKITVKCEDRTLDWYDYGYSYEVNDNDKTKLDITISGNGNYDGTKTVSIPLQDPVDLSGAEIKVDPESITGDSLYGEYNYPSVSVIINGKEVPRWSDVTEDENYSISFDCNKDTGKAVVTVSGKDMYTGTITKVVPYTDTRNATDDAIADLQKEAVDLKNQIDELKKTGNSQEINIKVEKLEKKVSDLETQVNTLQNKADTGSTDKADFTKLQNQVADLQKQLDEAKKNHSSTYTTTVIKQDSKETKAQIDALNKKVSDLESQLKNLQGQLDQKTDKTETAAWKAEIETLKTQISGMQTIIRNLTEANKNNVQIQNDYRITYTTNLVKMDRIENVKVVAKKGKKIKASWKKSDVNDLDGYRVYYSKKSDSGFRKLAATQKLKVTKKVKIQAGQNVYVKVRGYKKINGKTVWTKYSDVKAVTVRK